MFQPSSTSALLRSQGPRGAIAAAVLLAAIAAPRGASAFSYGAGGIGDPCHERLTWWALRQVRSDLGPVTAAPPANDEDEALADDLTFRIPSDVSDRAGLAILLGVRDNDLKGLGGRDADSLTFIHGDPDLQLEHCLRRPEHDEPGGSEAALADCRGFIKDHAIQALEGLNEAGEVDYGKQVPFEVTLSIRGQVDVDLPLFYVRMGQALHALQDGFSHTLRTPDGLRVTSVLNFIDEVDGVREEARDGAAHISGMDRCDVDDELRVLRVSLTEQASIEFLRAALDPSLSRAQKEAAFDAVLATYFTYEAGCTAENSWCDAPELDVADERSCSCRAAGAPTAGGAGGYAAALALAGVALGRWRRAAKRGATAALAFALALAAAPGVARADDPAEAPPGGNNDVQPVEHTGIYGTFGLGGSIDNAALAGRGGALIRLSSGWLAGLEGEWNPYLSSNTGRFHEGSVNIYGTVIRQYQLKYESVNLRTTLNAGISILAADLVGAPAGQIGPYVGLSPLGVEWKVARGFYVIFDPTHISIPVPNPKGAIFAYPQYRAMLGIQFGG